MFNRIKQKIYTLEVILDALMNVLHRKGLVTRSEIQIEILKTEEKKED